MSWQRAPVASALVAIITPVVGGIKVFPSPPELINGPAVVVSRPTTVVYNTVGMGIDEAELPVVIASGVEQEANVDALKIQVRHAIEADRTLQGSVADAHPTGERNWRNLTGAGGTQLLLVELVLQIRM